MRELTRGFGLTVPDIRRALLNGGDVSALMPVLHRALWNAPVPHLVSLKLPLVLPDAAALLEPVDAGLSSLVESWREGRERKIEGIQAELVRIGAAPFGRNIGPYLEKIISYVAPDIVAVDVSLSGLSAGMLYAFGMYGATGFTLRGDISDGDTGDIYASETFYPGNACQTVISVCWRDKIPLVPVGMPAGHEETTPNIFSSDISALRRQALYQAFDDSLEQASSPEGESLVELNHRLCSMPDNRTGGKPVEMQTEGANYIASRILDVSSVTAGQGRKPRLLAITDVGLYSDVGYALEMLSAGVTDEVYLPARYDLPNSITFSNCSDELAEDIRQHIPDTYLAQETFERELAEFSQDRESEQLTEAEFLRAVAAITGRTRNYRGILRGASVRGALALNELARSFGEMRDGLTWDSLEKAALVAMTPRITMKQGYYESPDDAVRDIIREVIYGIRFTGRPPGLPPVAELDWLTPEDMAALEQDLDSGEVSVGEFDFDENETKKIAVSEVDMQSLPDDFSFESMLEKASDSRYADSASKILSKMLDRLEEKFERGEISREQYQKEKHRIREMMNAASYLSSQAAGNEMAQTAFELMDAQDRHWSKKLNFQETHAYYHIRGTSENKELSPPKRNYYGLKMLIDIMEQEGMLKSVPQEESFTLTAEALNILLESMIPRSRKGKNLSDIMAIGKTTPTEHTYTIRRYSAGDVFRDISIRHTIREVARQRRKPDEIKRRDIRVFMRQPPKKQSDVVLCIDTSGSMGFRHKLIYARLAAASLVRTLSERGDRVGIIAFDDQGHTVLPLSSNKDVLMDCISGITAGGNTNIGDGLNRASELLRRPGQNQKYVVLITDGQPSAISREAFSQLNTGGVRDLTEEYAILETRKASAMGVKTSVLHITEDSQAGKQFVKSVADAGKGEVTVIRFVEDLGLVMP